MKLTTWLRAEWDRVTGFGLVGLGALFVLFGYFGVRGTPFVAEQMSYIASGGIGGLFCLGFGVGLLLTADLHDEWRKLDRLEAEMRGDPVPEPEADLVVLPSEPSASHVSSNGPDRTPVPQVVATSGAMATALTRPAGGGRQALGLVSLILLLPLTLAGLGWRRASQTADLDVAARGLGLAVAAAAIALVVLAVWALWVRTSVLRRLAAVTRGLRLRNRARLSGGTLLRKTVVGDEHTVFVASDHRRFHRAGCPMLQWLETVPRSRDHVEAGMSACGLCETA